MLAFQGLKEFESFQKRITDLNGLQSHFACDRRFGTILARMKPGLHLKSKKKPKNSVPLCSILLPSHFQYVYLVWIADFRHSASLKKNN